MATQNVGNVPLPRIIGHRGAAALAPENTLVSIARAAAVGAKMVEVDVKLTADGIPILLHDDTVDRTTNGHGAAADLTHAEINVLDAGSWFSREFAEEMVPTLEACLRLARQLKIGLNLEIKPNPGQDAETTRATIDQLRLVWPETNSTSATEIENTVLLTSFSREALETAAAHGAEYPRGLLLWDPPDDWREAAQSLTCCAIIVRKDIDQSLAGHILEAGFQLASYTINDIDHARRLASYGVQSIITDRPDSLLDRQNFIFSD